ncbi:sodium/proton antiporter, CPA1 family [Ligilactobacillus sp. WC1T17]|uniref:Sodium/proton antiporter, CPA1 family n=1 Tax=Ligilactobacillus ruminis TaxID=1623 RepID=A0ABY1A9R8_9LACO|nr:sodium/proton antiporter, CPA1 family [Ligilactobacillus ruminis]
MLLSTTILLLTACISSIISNYLAKISINYISLLLGVGLALIPFFNSKIESFETELFMIGIVAPLLYLEGQTTRLRNVRDNLKAIILVAIVLVVITAVITGFITSMVLKVTLPLAFLLAACATPTDATAGESVREGLIMPFKVDKALKMESLFNDATGLVLMDTMLLWFVQGKINYSKSLQELVFALVGGIVFGMFSAVVVISFRQGLARNVRYSSAAAQNILFLITPFIIYGIAEKIHVSGIIAVVCVGLLQNSESIRSRFVNPSQFHDGLRLMDMIQEILNNMVFVILGVTLVRIFNPHTAPFLMKGSYLWLAGGCLMYLLTCMCRYLFFRIERNSAKDSLAFALGGVHGAVTLALVFSISEKSIGSYNFSLLVLAETVYVLLSMLVPTVVFPFILERGLNQKEIKQKMLFLRNEMNKRGVKEVEQMYLPPQVKYRVLYDLRDQNNTNDLKSFWRVLLVSARYPDITPEQKELHMRALLHVFEVEKEFLDEMSQVEHMQSYVYQLYDDLLLSESILIKMTSKMED